MFFCSSFFLFESKSTEVWIRGDIHAHYGHLMGWASAKTTKQNMYIYSRQSWDSVFWTKYLRVTFNWCIWVTASKMFSCFLKDLSLSFFFFHLCLQSTAAPFWVSAPRNLILAPNETGILTCRVNGVPKPKISWFVNGVAIESELNEPLLSRNGI